MSNHLAKPTNGHSQSAAQAYQLALRSAISNDCDLLILTPTLQNAKGSEILESALGVDVYDQIVNKSKSVIISGTNNNIQLQTVNKMKSHLRIFDGVIFGLWLPNDGAEKISEKAIKAKDVFMVEWSDGELDIWAANNQAILI